MKVQYEGKCFRCGKTVKQYTGYFQPVNSLHKKERIKYLGKKWLLRCKTCIGLGNKSLLN